MLHSQDTLKHLPTLTPRGAPCRRSTPLPFVLVYGSKLHFIKLQKTHLEPRLISWLIPFPTEGPSLQELDAQLETRDGCKVKALA